MDIHVLGAWGEFLGGIGGLIAAAAIVGSLIFVGLQLRESTRQATVDSYTQITSLWTNYTNAVAASDDAWRIFYSGLRDYDSLPLIEQSRFNFLFGMYMGIIDTVVVHKQLGRLANQDTYRRNLEELERMFQLPGVQAWHRHYRGRVFAPHAEAYIVQKLNLEQVQSV